MSAGVAGDMLLGAMLALTPESGERLQRDLDALGTGPLPLRVEPVQVAGIAATAARVDVAQTADWQPERAHEHHHHGRHWSEIRQIIAAAPLSERARGRAQAAFALLAEAEGAVHGVDPERVHFHEVGARDAIADVVGCCLLLDYLDVERIHATPLVLGSGTVACAHGRMPVPVPAVAEMLERTGAPHHRLTAQTGELTTPTGCALVCSLADSWQSPDPLRLSGIGYGAGTRTIPGLANLVRVLLYEAQPQTADTVCELRTVVDDMTGEQLGWLIEHLLAAGALDAYALPATMKRGRPGHELCVLAAPAAEDTIADLLLSGSSAIGLRSHR
ncbi:MAG: nickel pincer cofactor biosynthesis protein LarC, partial [Planctomycetota bacterium]